MKISIINKVKYNPFLYNCYYQLGSLIISILDCLIKRKPNRIFFISFGGRKFDDSPKAIYEAMIKDDRFKGMDIVWGFQDPKKYDIPIGNKVKVDTIKYYISLLSSSYWITNSSVERGLSVPAKDRFYINTWHGTPIKKMGTDINMKNTSFSGKGNGNVVDVMMAQSDFDANIFSRVFQIPLENLAIIGLPRNDELITGNNFQNIHRIKKNLDIPMDKKVILYAPTFREFEKDDGYNCVLKPPINLEKWKYVLGDKFVFLLRAHYEVTKILNIKESCFVKDVSAYPFLNELMLVSDLLISDYSSIFFDYSILGKPMIPYCYDYETYSSKRGLYFDIRNELSCNVENEDSLINMIISEEYKKYIKNALNFRNKYIQAFGDATKKTLDIIQKHKK